jgi:hypothetical protein
MQILHAPAHVLHPGELLNACVSSGMCSNSLSILRSSGPGIHLASLKSIQQQGGDNHEETRDNRNSGSCADRRNGPTRPSLRTRRRRRRGWWCRRRRSRGRGVRRRLWRRSVRPGRKHERPVREHEWSGCAKPDSNANANPRTAAASRGIGCRTDDGFRDHARRECLWAR